ncbi:unnamed protein product [Cylicostephanus goldi]|uniref:Exonuclease 1 n=1 Tax=Cylicostephanus goldi TaxID=71465 RepID=A0A3P6QYB3_CYLGO|nr:unnamed protein product [Cylicostephanus goldi]
MGRIEKIVFKWNCDSGECTVYERKELPRCFSGVMSSQFDFTKFRRICILSGCDYLQAGLPGIGLNKALAFFSKTSRTDLKMLLPRIPSYLNMSKLTVSKEFIQEFIRAENTFIHQVVFDPRQRCQRPLTPYPVPQKQQSDENDDDFARSNDKDDYSYAGEVLSSNLAVRLALGNQIEKSVIMDKFFLPSPVPEWSVWCDQFESCGKRKRRIEETQKEEAKKCGSTFKFDSPSKKRVKLDPSTTIDVINLDEEDNAKAEVAKKGVETDGASQGMEKSVPKIERSNSSSSGKKENLETRPKRIKNQASYDWTVDEIMKAYGPTEQGQSTTSLPASPNPGTEKSIIAATSKT